MAYEYDAFFSYKRDPESDDWHVRVKKKLEFWLKLELSRDVALFLDKEDISSGERWREKIAEALKTSRCIICMWSPLYFRSRWCLSEWKTFVKRRELTNCDLVLAASYFDGETFPNEAQVVQYPDFRKFAFTIEAFWQSNRAVDFEDQCLKPFASDLAKIIRRAPAFREFPIVEATDAEVQLEGTIERIANG